MRGTKEALRVLGLSGTIENAEDLPEDSDVEKSFRYSKLMQMLETNESPQDFVSAIKAEQDELQQDFEEKKERIEQQLEEIDRGDKVRVETNTAHGVVEGIVRGLTIDRGHVFYKVYDDHELLGEFKDEYVEKLEEGENQ